MNANHRIKRVPQLEAGMTEERLRSQPENREHTAEVNIQIRRESKTGAIK